MTAARLACLLVILALAPLAPVSATAAVAPDAGWTAPHERDHPLVGRVWDTAAGSFISEHGMIDRLVGARFVLLGEKHDSIDHHRLQAQFLAAMVARGRTPAVAWEMIDHGQADALAEHQRTHPTDSPGLGAAVGWDETGWPSWEIYEPIAAAAMVAGLPMLPANLPREEVRALARQGLDGLPATRRQALDLPEPLPDPIAGHLRTAVVEGHCGMMPETMAEPMMRVQAARDAIMAHALIEGAAHASTDGAVLIAGSGHVRGDAGVPWHLDRRGADGGTLTVALMEVAKDITDPADYGPRYWTDRPPFDILVFTPVTDQTDPCEIMRKQLDRAHQTE